MEEETVQQPTEGDEKRSMLLFNRWDLSEVTIKDPSLIRYVSLQSAYVPHSSGRYAHQSFAKSHMLIVERLINRLMQKERNTGKKELTMRIVKDAFEKINKKTGKNPVQVLVDAISNTGPREETVRLKYGGINVPKSVDSAPQRRVDSSMRFICKGVYQASHKKKVSISDALANELIAAADGDSRSFGVSKKEEKERIAKAAR